MTSVNVEEIPIWWLEEPAIDLTRLKGQLPEKLRWLHMYVGVNWENLRGRDDLVFHLTEVLVNRFGRSMRAYFVTEVSRAISKDAPPRYAERHELFKQFDRNNATARKMGKIVRGEFLYRQLDWPPVNAEHMRCPRILWQERINKAWLWLQSRVAVKKKIKDQNLKAAMQRAMVRQFFTDPINDRIADELIHFHLSKEAPSPDVLDGWLDLTMKKMPEGERINRNKSRTIDIIKRETKQITENH